MIVIQRLDGLEIADLVDDLPRHASKRYGLRPRSAIDYIVVHHSATPPDTSASAIAAYHVNKRGWPGIGYHFVVTAAGTLFQTNRLETHAYHCAGYNRRSVGVCFLGDFTHTPPPFEQLEAGGRLLGWLAAQLTLEPAVAVVGHCELLTTECPGRQWHAQTRWRDALLQEIDAWLNQQPTA